MADIENDVHLKAAIIAGNSSAMDRAAGTLKRNIQMEAAKHNLTTAFMNSWHIATVPGETGTGRLVNDRVVYSTDPGALAINYGSLSGKRPHKTTDKRVPGKHVVEAAIGRSS